MRLAHLAAALAYLAVTLWTASAILPDLPGSHPYSRNELFIVANDTSHVVWAAARTARTLPTAPWRLWEYEFCVPLSHAVALGHHGYATAVLAMIPYWLTGEPMLAHNVAGIAMLWLSGIAMYAFAFYWTGSVPAAFVAGIVFAFQLERVSFLPTPSIVANEWTPLTLLFGHRLFVRRRWRDAAGLALCGGMQVLESFYQLVPLAVLGLVYGSTVTVRHRTDLVRLLPKLAGAAAFVATLLVIVMWPYVHTRNVWGLKAAFSLYPPANVFAFGQPAYPGTTLLALAAIGVVDRFFRRDADDPRWPLLVAGIVLFLLLVGGVVVPGVGMIPSPGRWLVPWIPGMDAVRVPRLSTQGVWLVLALFAAYGMRRLVERRPAPVQLAATIGLSLLALAEVTYPPLAHATFGADARIDAAPIGVSRPLVRFLDRELSDGAVIDLPVVPIHSLLERRHRVMLGAFHRHALAECFTSFASPLAQDVNGLAARLPDPGAAAALYALGFRNIIVHQEHHSLLTELRELPRRLQSMSTGDPRLVYRGQLEDHHVFRLESAAPTAADVALLAAGVADDGATTVAPPASTAGVEFVFRDGGAATFRHPDPIEPAPFVVRWYDGSSSLIAEQPVRMVLPLALAAGDRASRWVPLATPAAGSYRVTLAPAETPETVVSVAHVDVRSQ